MMMIPFKQNGSISTKITSSAVSKTPPFSLHFGHIHAADNTAVKRQQTASATLKKAVGFTW